MNLVKRCSKLFIRSRPIMGCRITKDSFVISRGLSCTGVHRNVVDVKESRKSVTVTFNNNSKHDFHYVWLRDHCRCKKCFNAATNQREVENIIPVDIQPKSVGKLDDKLQIIWKDDHITTYEGSWLQKHHYGQTYSSILLNEVDQYFWGSELKVNMPPTVNYTKLLTEDTEVLKLLETITKYGFGFVSETPTTVKGMQDVCHTIGPVKHTFYGGAVEFSNISVDQLEHFDSSYLNVGLNGHTDGTYFSDAPGLQLFHCHQHTGGEGGETLLVDGIGAAYKLKECDPESFEFLCSTALPAQYYEPGNYNKILDTMIKIDPSTKEICQVRINNYDRDVLTCMSYDDVEKFYKSLLSFMSIIKNPENELWFKLTPGNLIVINNWRVLHGRSSFSGSRTMATSYMCMDDVSGKLRALREKY